MIVDIHTRIWDSADQLGRSVSDQLRRSRRLPWAVPDGSAEAHDKAMAPVDNAIILGFESKYLGAAIPHEQVVKSVKRNPDKYLGFAGIDPLADNALESLAEARTMGLVGVAVSPATQSFHPATTEAMDLYEACEALGMPVFIESGSEIAREAKMEFAQPYLLDEVARTFPKLKLIVSSIGHPFVEQGLALIAKHPTFYADLSDLMHRPWQLYNALVQAYHLGVMDQLLFGSNFPFCTPEKAIMTIYSVNTMTQGTNLPSVPREQLRSIVERDAITCLGLRAGREGDAAEADQAAGQDGEGEQADSPAAQAADAASGKLEETSR